MIVVTITNQTWSPGRYHYSTIVNGRSVITGQTAGHGEHAAAAKAIEIAAAHRMQCKVIAPKKVMDLIPDELNIK